MVVRRSLDGPFLRGERTHKGHGPLVQLPPNGSPLRRVPLDVSHRQPVRKERSDLAGGGGARVALTETNVLRTRERRAKRWPTVCGVPGARDSRETVALRGCPPSPGPSSVPPSPHSSGGVRTTSTSPAKPFPTLGCRPGCGVLWTAGPVPPPTGAVTALQYQYNLWVAVEPRLEGHARGGPRPPLPVPSVP